MYVTTLLTMVLVKSCFVGDFICWQTFLNVPTLERRRPPCNSSSKRDNAAKAGASFNPFHGQGLFSRWRLSYLTIQESLETLKSCIRWSNNLITVLYIFIHPAPIWSNLSQPKCTKLVTAHKPICFAFRGLIMTSLKLVGKPSPSKQNLDLIIYNCHPPSPWED